MPYVGSNPTPTMAGGQASRNLGPGIAGGEREQVISSRRSREVARTKSRCGDAGVAQLVEHQPSKLRVAGSSPVARSVARVAQSVERVLGKDEVTGSIPV